MSESDVQIRCICAVHPILAIARVSSTGTRFVHIRIYKQKKIYGEIVVESGLVRIRCRSCGRWYSLHVRHDSHEAIAERLPGSIKLPPIAAEITSE